MQTTIWPIPCVKAKLQYKVETTMGQAVLLWVPSTCSGLYVHHSPPSQQCCVLCATCALSLFHRVGTKGEHCGHGHRTVIRVRKFQTCNSVLNSLLCPKPLCWTHLRLNALVLSAWVSGHIWPWGWAGMKGSQGSAGGTAPSRSLVSLASQNLN